MVWSASRPSTTTTLPHPSHIKKKAKKKVFRYRESNPALVGHSDNPGVMKATDASRYTIPDVLIDGRE
jgi:hypothetical protein